MDMDRQAIDKIIRLLAEIRDRLPAPTVFHWVPGVTTVRMILGTPTTTPPRHSHHRLAL